MRSYLRLTDYAVDRWSSLRCLAAQARGITLPSLFHNRLVDLAFSAFELFVFRPQSGL